MANDLLGGIVGSLDISGSEFFRSDQTDTCSINGGINARQYRLFASQPRSIIEYHLITEGTARVSVDEEGGSRKYHRARPGSVVLLTSDVSYPREAVGLSDAGPGKSRPTAHDRLHWIERSAESDRVCVLSVFMAVNAGQSPLLVSLPRFLLVDIDAPETRRWIEASLSMAANQHCSGTISSQELGAGVCQLVLIAALKPLIEERESFAECRGGVADPRIAKALLNIHANLSEPSPVNELATSIGMSRSSFVSKFGETLGVEPRRYIVKQRMETAKQLLESSGLTLAEIAFRVGYNSPEAFSRTFKRETGYAPSIWRNLPNCKAC